MSNWKELVKQVAPVVGTALGGPLAGMAVKVIGETLLGNKDATEEDIKEVLKVSSPEMLVKLQEIEKDFKKELLKVGLDEKKLEMLDRKNAREREIATKDNMPAILALLLTFGFFGILMAIIFYPIPHEANNIINIMIGSLGTAWTSIVSYYFGSSYGSKLKNEMLKSKGSYV